MPLQIIEVFVNVITPVIALVIIGYLAGNRLHLDERTLSKVAYYVFVPAFVFDIMSTADIKAQEATRMFIFILAVVVGSAILGFVVAKALKRPIPVIGAYVLIASFGNIGNFGLPLIEFRLGPEAMIPATFYFLVMNMSGFVIGVFAASWATGGSKTAVLSVLKTPALIALAFALLANRLPFESPLVVNRIIGLLSAAMIPIMLITLGVKLFNTRQIHITRDVVIASSIKLIGAPAIAVALATLFGISGLARSTGIMQAAMPAAVLTSIIAIEHDLVPDFVTTTVLFSTLASVFTLTVVLAIL